MHDDYGKNVLRDKYVGDIIAADGSNKDNIKDRTDKGYGIVNEIISMLDEIPLGPYKISVGLKLREAMFLNGILFNSEIWYNVKDDELDKLCSVDEYLLRSIIKAPSKTPKEALYLETGCLSIKYCVKMRRLMYLHHILKRPKEEMIRKVYEAQKCKPSKGDWAKTVDEDRSELQINLNDDEVSKLSKHKFRKVVKKSVYKKHLRT